MFTYWFNKYIFTQIYMCIWRKRGYEFDKMGYAGDWWWKREGKIGKYNTDTWSNQKISTLKKIKHLKMKTSGFIIFHFYILYIFQYEDTYLLFAKYEDCVK